MNINQMRVQVASSIDLTAANSIADFYYYWAEQTKWKTVWAAGPGSNFHYNSSTFNNSSVPRISLKQFNFAYNLKFGYTANTQQWANLSDPGTSGSTGTESWSDWYSGLTSPGVTLGTNMRDDGSLGIIPDGNTSTGAGQDCNSNNAKYGYDDSV